MGKMSGERAGRNACLIACVNTESHNAQIREAEVVAEALTAGGEGKGRKSCASSVITPSIKDDK